MQAKETCATSSPWPQSLETEIILSLRDTMNTVAGLVSFCSTTDSLFRVEHSPRGTRRKRPLHVDLIAPGADHAPVHTAEKALCVKTSTRKYDHSVASKVVIASLVRPC